MRGHLEKRNHLPAMLALLVAASLVVGAAPASAEPQTTSDLLLPYFEVDFEPSGRTTLFAVGNSGGDPVTVKAAVFSNWGIELVSTRLELAPSQVRTVNLRDWLFTGELPTRKIGPAELAHLQAAFSGQASPRDNLYYGTEDVPGRAVGYVTLRVTSTPRSDVLWGDYFWVDPGQDFAEGELLVDIDKTSDCPGLCDHHLMRFLEGGGFDGGTKLIVWSPKRRNPSPTPLAAGALGVGNVISVSDFHRETGEMFDQRDLDLLPVHLLDVRDLFLAEPFGWLDLGTEEDVYIGVRYSADSRYSVTLQTWCVKEPPRPPKPKKARVDIEKSTNGEDADEPLGPLVAPDSLITWRYVVRNTGDLRLTDVLVTDDKEGSISCPKTSLDAGESMTCTATGTAQGTAGTTYANVGTVTGRDPSGKVVRDEDPSHYTTTTGPVGPVFIDVEKETNGEDADTPTGPEIPVGDPVTWTYVVTNPNTADGGIRLFEIELDDDKLGAIPCPKSELAPGESMTCTASGTAQLGQYANLATVRGEDEFGTEATDSDPSHYLGIEPPKERIDLEKKTNGEDADTPTGPIITVGDPVTWTYEVRNAGDVPLTAVSVMDDELGAISCPKSTLAPGESMTCTANGTAVLGQYRNEGWAEGKTPDGKTVEDHDPSHYKGVEEPSIDVEKSTNGQDADVAPGPEILVGDPVNWKYVVRNDGNVALSDVSVLDDKLGPITCPKSALAPGESMTCTAKGTAVEGQYRNEAWAEGTSPGGETVEDHDPSHYYGKKKKEPSIDVEKSTNGHDADLPPGPTIEEGDPVTWTYVVTNTGNVRLTDIALMDDILGTITCPKKTLLPGESMTCTASGTAERGQYRNEAWVSGFTPERYEVEDHDPSHYYGEADPPPKIDLEKATNGHDADHAPGPSIHVGSPVTWTYRVKNVGQTPLSDVSVMDDKLGAISCPKSSLAPGESMTCSANGTAEVGQYRNEGWAEGTSPKGVKVEDHDPSHYFGKEGPAIDVEKSTNGHDADQPTGPTLEVGEPVEWTYVVRNTGNVRLTGITLSDDKLGTISCPETALDPGESMTCSANGTAREGQYRNEAWVEGTSPAGKTVEDHDPSHYKGVEPKIDLEKATNGHDADQAPGPKALVGSEITWTYRVRNLGQVPLSDVSVMDDKLGAISCPKSTLAVGESMTCQATGTAREGQYRNEGWAEGRSPKGKKVEDHDPSHYFGEEGPAIDVEKSTNGEDADTPTGPTIHVGDAVEWTYVVRNTGDVRLTGVTLSDDKLGAISCPKSALAPGESMTCTADGTAVLGQYRNEAWVEGTSPAGKKVEDHDPSHYFGADPKIDLEKATNGHDADTPAGPTIIVGDPVEWTYVVTNTGNVRLIDVAVSDDKLGAISCPKSALAPGESMTCTANGTAEAGQYRNEGWAEGTSTAGKKVEDHDPSHYFGEEPCGPCLGKVSRLTVRYLGGSAANVRVLGKRGPSNDVLFDDLVFPGGTFELIGPPHPNGGFDGTLGTEIDYFVDGTFDTNMHTSCSQPIGPGLVSGRFEVIRGESNQGGPLCPI